ncbi:hypothetical protein [Janthinobacterium sp. FW305-128]|uniref:hypothetical protein n=1 Tax=Janthinobacterium sp. FW305-128 TaxID=2775055 RepID=UPI001E5C2FD8|nr:hypothetical protein [Janthinobacterium sp. FW305-128]MCC7684781.1 hypothetical protein [Janthinobacterium sp. FW305-128]
MGVMFDGQLSMAFVCILLFIALIIFISMVSDFVSSYGAPSEIYINEAREIAGSNLVLQERINDFLANGAPQEKRDWFLSSLRIAADDAKIKSIFLKAGIDKPSGTDRLMATQVLALQEQNALLKKKSV